MFGPDRLTDADRRGDFPADACAALASLGLHRHLVPIRLGGALAGHDELAALVRVVASHDLTVAATQVETYAAVAPVWAAGDPAQAAAVAAVVTAGERAGLARADAPLAARTERAAWYLHGRGVLAAGDGRIRLACVTARPTRGADDSLLLVDLPGLPAGGHFLAAPRGAYGLRGAGIRDIVFTGAATPAEAVVGGVGNGADVLAQARRRTVAGTVGLSLGAADQALRLGAEFCHSRRLYGGRLADLPAVRRTLGEAYARLFLAEAVAVVATRGVTALPAESAVMSTVARSYVPTAVQHIVDTVGELLGARAFLSTEYAGGRFARIQCGHRVAAVLYGVTPAERSALAAGSAPLAAGYHEGWNVIGLAAALDLAGATAPPRPAPPAPATCSLLQALPAATAEVADLAGSGRIRPELAGAAQELLRRADAVHRDLAVDRPTPDRAGLAGRYEQVFAGAAALQLWLANRRRVPAGASAAPWADGRWLEACLAVVLGHRAIRRDAAHHLFVDLSDLVAPGEASSVLPAYLREEAQ